MQEDNNKKSWNYMNLHRGSDIEYWKKILHNSIVEGVAPESSFDKVENVLVINNSVSELKRQPLNELMCVISLIAEQNKLDLVITEGGIYSTKYAFDRVRNILEKSITHN